MDSSADKFKRLGATKKNSNIIGYILVGLNVNAEHDVSDKKFNVEGLNVEDKHDVEDKNFNVEDTCDVFEKKNFLTVKDILKKKNFLTVKDILKFQE